MFELISLGFREEEIHRAFLDEQGRFFIPAEWHGDHGYFMVGTVTRLDVSLNGVGVRIGKLPLLRAGKGFDVYQAEELTILGKTRAAGEITAFHSSDEGTVLGTIGSLFFREATVALDPAGPYVARSTRPWMEPEGDGFFALPLIGESGLPLTNAIRFEADPALEQTTLLSTGTVQSYISHALADALPRWSAGGGRATRIRFPNGTTHDLVLDVAETMPEYVVDLGTQGIGMVLGLDVLRSFLTVLQLGAKRACFRTYGRAI